jgi:hypothetical protein
MKHHGIGVGYRSPHDYEGADVDQRYLPEVLGDRRYFVPSDQGYEQSIGGRLDRIREVRAAGPATRVRNAGPAVDGMRVGGAATRAREETRRRLADAQRRDAD